VYAPGFGGNVTLVTPLLKLSWTRPVARMPFSSVCDIQRPTVTVVSLAAAIIRPALEAMPTGIRNSTVVPNQGVS
jgi:hypothetical protein